MKEIWSIVPTSLPCVGHELFSLPTLSVGYYRTMRACTKSTCNLHNKEAEVNHIGNKSVPKFCHLKPYNDIAIGFSLRHMLELSKFIIGTSLSKPHHRRTSVKSSFLFAWWIAYLIRHSLLSNSLHFHFALYSF